MAGASFNPAERRDGDGKWTAGASGAVSDALKLAGRIKLGPGEHFGGSAAISDRDSGVSTALARIDGPGGMRLRVGVVNTEDERRWSAEPKGRTVELDAAGAADLQKAVRQSLDDGKRSIAEYRAELRKAIKAGKPVDEWPDTSANIAKGTVHGSRWGDLDWTLTREEGGDFVKVGGEEVIDAEMSFHLAPRTTTGGTAGEDFNTRSAQALKKLDKALGDLIGAPTVQAAAGMDTHPGGEQLKHYWLVGEGAAKWSTWTELYVHLVKYLSPDMAKRTAAQWYHERFGIWPGSDANRVTHGKPPRGEKVGPG